MLIELLIALDKNLYWFSLPDKILAVATEGWVLEKPGDEFVVFDLIDVFLLESPLTLPLPPGGGLASAFGPVILGASVVLVLVVSSHVVVADGVVVDLSNSNFKLFAQCTQSL